MNNSLSRPWKRLKAARIAAGFKTAKHFSDMLGLNQVTYNNHERPPTSEGGKGRRFDLTTANKYAELLVQSLSGISGEWLLHNTGEPPLELLPGAPEKQDVDGVETEDQADFISQTADGHIIIEAKTIDREFMTLVINGTDEFLHRQGWQPRPHRRAALYNAIYTLADARRSEGKDMAEVLDFSGLVDVVKLAC